MYLIIWLMWSLHAPSTERSKGTWNFSLPVADMRSPHFEPTVKSGNWNMASHNIHEIYSSVIKQEPIKMYTCKLQIWFNLHSFKYSYRVITINQCSWACWSNSFFKSIKILLFFFVSGLFQQIFQKMLCSACALSNTVMLCISK